MVGTQTIASTEVLIDPDLEARLRWHLHIHPDEGTTRPGHNPNQATFGAVSSNFGTLFRIATFGESHGPAVGVIVDGCPPRLEISAEEIQAELDKRRPGQSRLVTQRDEADQVEVLSGLFEGQTTGTSIALVVRNADHNSGAYDHLKDLYRPSHADYTYEAKFGIRDHRGGGRSSARETIGRVAAAAIARKLLTVGTGVEIVAWVDEVHTINASVDSEVVTSEMVEGHPTRCPDPEAADAMASAIEQARRDGDSLGGVVKFVVRNVPVGLGEPVFDKLDADLAKALMSLPATKGFEIGSGFAGTQMTGLSHNDAFTPGADGKPETATNNSGGIQGGMSNGAAITGRIAFKPTATISSEQDTVNTDGKAVKLAAKGRHDPCVLPRAIIMVESMIALVLADHWLRQKALDVL